jgi:hypothetical protein
MRISQKHVPGRNSGTDGRFAKEARKNIEFARVLNKSETQAVRARKQGAIMSGVNVPFI